MIRRIAECIGGVLLSVAALNFFAFHEHARRLGGGALNGKKSGGRFFVGGHGHYTEVPERTWRLMRAHEISAIVTHPLTLLVGVPLLMASQWTSGSRSDLKNPDAAPDGGEPA